MPRCQCNNRSIGCSTPHHLVLIYLLALLACWSAGCGVRALQSAGLANKPMYKTCWHLTVYLSVCPCRSSLQAQDVVMTLWAAAKLGHHHPQLFDRMMWRAVITRAALKPWGVAVLLCAVAQVGHRPDPRAVAQLLQVGPDARGCRGYELWLWL